MSLAPIGLDRGACWRVWFGDNRETLLDGLRRVELIANTCFNMPAAVFENSLSQATLPVLSSPGFKESFETNTYLISFIISPFSIVKYLGSAVIHFQAATEAVRRLSYRIYHVAQGSLNLTNLGATVWVIYKGLTLMDAKFKWQAMQKFAYFQNIAKFYTVSSLILPIVNALEVYQATLLEKGELVDSGVIEECFGTIIYVKNSESDEQLAQYKKMKMVLTANAVIEMVAKHAALFFPPVVPISYGVLVGTGSLKVLANFYWSHKVKGYRDQNKPLTPLDKALQATALITFGTLPFLLIPQTSLCALGGLLIVTATDIALSIRFKKVSMPV